ncbi:MAG: hypothetical protein JW909_14020 [Planctomycetes bacterium]|nr:hypothetical protein [Planctomycetota bacterium]
MNEIVRRIPAAAGFCAAIIFLVQTPVFPEDIVLPELLAVEIPAPGAVEISDADSPLHELLVSATAGGLQVTYEPAGAAYPLGGTEVTWTSWTGEPYASAVDNTATAYVYVFRFGETPVGLTAYERATAGNHSTKVVRDASGRIHCVWQDHGRPAGTKVMYRRGTQDQDTGAVTWDIPPAQLGFGEGNIRSHPAIAASPNAVHVVWYEYAGGAHNTYYRRIFNNGGSWVMEAPVITGVTDRRTNNGPDIVAVSDTEVHFVSVGASYLWSTNCDEGDAGTIVWQTEAIPMSGSTPSLALDSQKNAHVVYTKSIRSAGTWSTTTPNGGYWQIAYLVRDFSSGTWSAEENVLAAFPEWGDPRAGHIDTDPEWMWDILTDWIDIETDAVDNVHVGWHGTLNTHIFGNDEAFYIMRPSTGPGAWGPWGLYRELHPVNPSEDQYFSWCPALCVDAASNLALAVPFYNTLPTESEYGYQSFFRVLRGGDMEGDPVELSLAASAGLCTWDTCTGSRVYRHPNGRAWLDVLQNEMTPAGHASPYVITYQHYEITDLLYPDQAAGPTPAHDAVSVPLDTMLSWGLALRATGYDVYFGTDPAAVAAATHASPEFMCTQAGAVFGPGTLQFGVDYYWRIDAVNFNGVTGGAVWHFTAVPDTGVPAVSAAEAILSGTVDDDTFVPAAVLVDGVPRTVSAGNWVSQSITLPAASPVVIEATDSNANTRTLTIEITAP